MDRAAWETWWRSCGEDPLEPAVEQHAAEVLLDWYSNEMYELSRS